MMMFGDDSTRSTIHDGSGGSGGASGGVGGRRMISHSMGALPIIQGGNGRGALAKSDVDQHAKRVNRLRLTTSDTEQMNSPGETHKKALETRKDVQAQVRARVGELHRTWYSNDMSTAMLLASDDPVYSEMRYEELLRALETFIISGLQIENVHARRLRRFVIPENWILDDYERDITNAKASAPPGVDAIHDFIRLRLGQHTPSRPTVLKKMYEDAMFGVLLAECEPFRAHVMSRSYDPEKLIDSLFTNDPENGRIGLCEMMNHTMKKHSLEKIPGYKKPGPSIASFLGGPPPTTDLQHPDSAARLPLFSEMYATLEVFVCHLRTAVLVEYGIPYGYAREYAEQKMRSREEDRIRLAILVTGFGETPSRPKPYDFSLRR